MEKKTKSFWGALYCAGERGVKLGLEKSFFLSPRSPEAPNEKQKMGETHLIKYARWGGGD